MANNSLNTILSRRSRLNHLTRGDYIKQSLSNIQQVKIMGPGRNLRIIQGLVIILMGCILIVGTVSAFGVMHYWTDSSGRTWSGFWDSCLDSNQSICPFGSTCGGAELVVTLGMAHFSATPSSGQSPLKVQFSSNSASDIDSWSWDFGDGSYGSGINPVHTYTTPGTYTVKLTVRTEQAFGDGPESAYIAWGQENTFVEPDMIQVYGSVNTLVNQVSAEDTAENSLVNGATTPVVNNVQRGSIIQYNPDMFQLESIQKIRPDYVQTVKSSQSVTGIPLKRIGNSVRVY
jgi:hypothetical protein